MLHLISMTLPGNDTRVVFPYLQASFFLHWFFLTNMRPIKESCQKETMVLMYGSITSQSNSQVLIKQIDFVSSYTPSSSALPTSNGYN